MNRPVASDLGPESQHGRCGPRCVFGDRSPHRPRHGAGRSAIAGRGRYVEPRAARRQRISFPLGRGLPSIDIADGKSRGIRCDSHSSALGTRQRAAVSGSEMATTPRYRPCDRLRSRRSWPSGLSLTPWVGPSGTASKRIPWNPGCPITRTSPDLSSAVTACMISGASAATAHRLNSCSAGFKRASPRQWPWAPALGTQSHHGVPDMACRARPLTTAIASSAAGALPAVGGDCWAMTAAQRCGEAAVRGPAVV